MGSPMSLILANITMDRLEISLLSKRKLKFIMYTRFVNDGLLIYNSDCELDYFLQDLHSFHPKSKFTIELALGQ